MPTEGYGAYEQGLTLGTEVSSTYEGRHITATAAELNHGNILAVVTKGYPVIFNTGAGAHGVGVAFNTEVAGTDLIAVDTEGIWNLSVLATNDAADAGGVVIAGDPLFINTTTAIISKIRNNITQIPFGYALGGVAQDATATIAVKVHWDPRAHWLPEDEPLIWGDDDHKMLWTGEEIAVTGDRTTGGDGDYYRVFHVASGVTLGAADRWGTISCYTVMSGAPTTATSAFAGSFSLVQETVQVTGFFGAVMAEIKNEADNCNTACALFCRWDNDSAVGFGGVMHSFIRFEDNSSALNVQCLFELYLMDATAAAASDVIVCQAGAANTASHVIKISANGVPYWILMDSTPPA